MYKTQMKWQRAGHKERGTGPSKKKKSLKKSPHKKEGGKGGHLSMIPRGGDRPHQTPCGEGKKTG